MHKSQGLGQSSRSSSSCIGTTLHFPYSNRSHLEISSRGMSFRSVSAKKSSPLSLRVQISQPSRPVKVSPSLRIIICLSLLMSVLYLLLCKSQALYEKSRWGEVPYMVHCHTARHEGGQCTSPETQGVKCGGASPPVPLIIIRRRLRYDLGHTTFPVTGNLDVTCRTSFRLGNTTLRDATIRLHWASYSCQIKVYPPPNARRWDALGLQSFYTRLVE